MTPRKKYHLGVDKLFQPPSEEAGSQFGS